MTNNNKKTVVYMETQRNINYESGHILSETTTQTSREPQEPPFVKMYIGSVCMLRGVPKGAQDTLLAILRKLDYEGYITLSTRYRQKCCEELGIKEQTFKNNLAKLCKKGIIRNVGRNEYLADPNLFARGHWKDIVKQKAAFTMTVSFKDGQEPEIKTQADYNQEQDIAM